jgi:gluconate:H+ symporter, GntP family
LVGLMISGHGFEIRHLVEGAFGYVDTLLIIATAMIFMKMIQYAGTMEAFKYYVIKKFINRPRIILLAMTFVVMFPGMITGSATAAVLSTGGLIAPVLISMGIPMIETAAIIAIAGMLGMLAPPVNVPVMIIGGGVDMPYSGFALPLLALAVPLAIFSSLYLGNKFLKNVDKEKLRNEMEKTNTHKTKVFFPIVVLVFLMITTKMFPQWIPDLGLPLIFIISAIAAFLITEEKKIKVVLEEALRDALPVLGILVGVGMFIQVMTLTGVRGYIVVTSLSIPEVYRYIVLALSLPLFGAISSYGAASVLGVPFLLAFIAKNQIITASAISLIASLGDMMPPTALAGIFAAKVVGLSEYKPVLIKSIVPALAFIVYGIIFIYFADKFAAILL